MKTVFGFIIGIIGMLISFIFFLSGLFCGMLMSDHSVEKSRRRKVSYTSL